MTVTDEAIGKIRDMIVAGDLLPGQRLPPEKELSDALGLSRSSLREAVKALELIRVLDVRRGDGTYVTTLEPRLLLEAVSFVVDVHQDRSLMELLEVRRILEPAASAMAAARMDVATIRALRALIDDVESSTTVEELVAHDLDFHAQIVAAGGNDYLASLIGALSGSTARVRVWRGLTESGAVRRTLSEHAAIVDALESGDVELVRALVTVHVSGVERWLSKAVGSQAPQV
ncbi:MAG: FadR family transcriptional regulator [Alphaproteobacteria bacterium]|nr:MAG: FadR family transcriptional regulator [Alphaproteobacteria bacterium]